MNVWIDETTIFKKLLLGLNWWSCHQHMALKLILFTQGWQVHISNVICFCKFASFLMARKLFQKRPNLILKSGSFDEIELI